LNGSLSCDSSRVQILMLEKNNSVSETSKPVSETSNSVSETSDDFKPLNVTDFTFVGVKEHKFPFRNL